MVTFSRQVALRKVDLHSEIIKGNITAALIDFGHVISVAIVIRSALIWVLTEGWYGLPIVVAAFIIGVCMLLISQYVCNYLVYQSQRWCLHQAIKDNNIAVGIRYAGT